MLILALVEIACGNVEEAEKLQVKCLKMHRQFHDRRMCVLGLEGMATRASAAGDYAQVMWCYGVCESARASMGYDLCAADQKLYESNVAAAREALGEEMAALRWEEGRGLPLFDAVDAVLSEAEGPEEAE